MKLLGKLVLHGLLWNIQFRAVRIMGLPYIEADSLSLSLSVSEAVYRFPGEFPGDEEQRHKPHRHFCRPSPTGISRALELFFRG